MDERAIDRTRTQDRRRQAYHARAPGRVRALVNAVKAGKLPISALPPTVADAYVEGRLDEMLDVSR